MATVLWTCSAQIYTIYLCRRTKIQILKSLLLLVLFNGCEAWTLNNDQEVQIDVSGCKFIQRVMGYIWSDFVSNQ